MTMSRLRSGRVPGVVVGFAVIGAVLLGCSSAPEPEPTSSAAPEGALTVLDLPSLAVFDEVALALAEAEGPGEKPRLSDLVLSIDGLGPLRVGEPLPAWVEEVGMLRWESLDCGGGDGRYEPRYNGAAGVWDSDAPPFGLGVHERGGRLGGVQLFTDAISTDEGIAIGATRDELLDAYYGGTLQGPAQGNGTDLYWIEEGEWILVFEVVSYRSYFAPKWGERVVIIMLYERRGANVGTEPYSAVATDWIIGGCL